MPTATKKSIPRKQKAPYTIAPFLPDEAHRAKLRALSARIEKERKAESDAAYVERERDRVKAWEIIDQFNKKNLRPSVERVQASESGSANPTHPRAKAKRRPASPELVFLVLTVAKKEMPGLDLKKARSKWLSRGDWNLGAIAKHLFSGGDIHISNKNLSQGTIRNILSAHRNALPRPVTS